MTITVSSQVSKETYELMVGIADFVGAIKKCLADGWQPGTDIPVILTDCITILVPAIDGASQIKTEAAADVVAFSRAVSIGASIIFEKLK